MNRTKIKKSPRLAILGLFLAFVPALIFLSVIGRFSLGSKHDNLFWGACCVSVVCCFASSSLLFRHKTILAILVGALFLLINLMISFLLGCGAVLSS
jgi:hypothetical protein